MNFAEIIESAHIWAPITLVAIATLASINFKSIFKKKEVKKKELSWNWMYPLPPIF